MLHKLHGVEQVRVTLYDTDVPVTRSNTAGQHVAWLPEYGRCPQRVLVRITCNELQKPTSTLNENPSRLRLINASAYKSY